jgi:hypothetical protein
MATITHGADGIRTDVSSRSAPQVGASDGMYNKITNFSGSLGGINDALDFTGSVQPARAMLINSAHGIATGTTKIWAKDGGSVDARALTGSVGSIIEIGVKRVSGSGNIDFLH